jgi:hypothetical protein
MGEGQENGPDGRPARRGTAMRVRAAAVAAAALAIIGAVLLVVALTWHRGPPRPDAAAPTTSAPAPSHPGQPPQSAHSPDRDPSRAGDPTTVVGSSGRAPGDSRTRGPLLPHSVPLSIDIPAIGVQSPLLQLGLNPDHTVEVPPLDEPDSEAGWYKYSPTPGELGPSVILGHVDSAHYGPAVFYKLGELRPNDLVEVTRADGSVAVFAVDRVAEYSKARFPTQEVYGNLDHAGLRLITCGGAFDFSARSYRDNVVVFASLVSSHPAGSGQPPASGPATDRGSVH